MCTGAIVTGGIATGTAITGTRLTTTAITGRITVLIIAGTIMRRSRFTSAPAFIVTAIIIGDVKGARAPGS